MTWMTPPKDPAEMTDEQLAGSLAYTKRRMQALIAELEKRGVVLCPPAPTSVCSTTFKKKSSGRRAAQRAKASRT